VLQVAHLLQAMRWLKKLWFARSSSKCTFVSCEKVNLGCGIHYHSDWDNYDCEPAEIGVRSIDLSQPLPFPEASYEVCYMSHVLEHLPRERVPKLLVEVFRALRPGGVLRVVVPDLEMIVRLYLSELDRAAGGDKEASLRHEWMTLELIDQMTRTFSGGFMGRTLSSRPLPHREFIEKRIGWEGRHWLESVDRSLDTGSKVLPLAEIYNVPQPEDSQEAVFRQSGEVHRWMYDRVSLSTLLKTAGFGDIQACSATRSSIPNFSSYGLDTHEDGSTRKPDSLFMEARKPHLRKTESQSDSLDS
jgi:predicted SAM-dependent methyltransferase